MISDEANIKDLEEENLRLKAEVKRLRGKLEEFTNEDRYGFVLQNSYDAVIITDPDLTITLWNKGAERLFGWKAEEVVGLKTTDVTFTEYPNVGRDKVKDILENEGVWTGEVLDRTKSGNIIITHLSALKLKDSRGKHEGYATINSDVTRQQELENELRQSFEQFEMLSNNSLDLYCLHNPDGDYEWISGSMKNLLGYDPQEMLGKNPYDFIHPEDTQLARETVHDPILNKEIEKKKRSDLSTFRFRKVDGTYIYLEVITSGIYDDEGHLAQILSASRDVTQRMAAEQALLESKQKIQHITDAIPFCVSYIDKGSKFQFCNKQFEAWFDLDAKLLEGASNTGLEALDKLLFDAKALQLVSKGEEVNFESSISNRAVSVRLIPDLDNQLRFRGFFSIIEDITDRRLREKELQDLAKFPSENRDPIFRINMHGELLYFNEAAESMLSSWKHFKDGQFDTDFLDIIHHSLKKEESKDIEAKFNDRSYILTITPVKEHDYVIVYTSSITRQKKAESALMDRIEYERLLVDITSKLINLRSPDIDQGINYALNEVGNFVKADEAFVFALDDEADSALCTHHWSRERNIIFKGKTVPFRRLVPWFTKKLQESFIFNYRKPADLPRSAKIEKEVMARLGMVSICIVPLVKDEMVIGFAGFHSRTERKDWGNMTINLLKVLGEVFINALQNQQYEQALKGAQSTLEYLVEQRTAELKRSNKDLEKFAYLASHDLQEPLRMIISYLQILEKRIKDNLKEDELEFLNFSVDGAKRMKGLLDAILQYSRINQYKQPFSEVELSEPIQSAIQNLKMTIDQSEAQLEVGVMPKVQADEVQITQLFQNLIANAVKFVEGRKPNIKIWLNRDDEIEYEFAVSDNGIGIEDRYLERIFDIFQRLYPKNHYEGSGIGLAICKNIVDRHGGKIWVESEVGKGTTFFFTLKKEHIREKVN